MQAVKGHYTSNEIRVCETLVIIFGKQSAMTASGKWQGQLA